MSKYYLNPFVYKVPVVNPMDYPELITVSMSSVTEPQIGMIDTRFYRTQTIGTGPDTPFSVRFQLVKLVQQDFHEHYYATERPPIIDLSLGTYPSVGSFKEYYVPETLLAYSHTDPDTQNQTKRVYLSYTDMRGTQILTCYNVTLPRYDLSVLWSLSLDNENCKIYSFHLRDGVLYTYRVSDQIYIDLISADTGQHLSSMELAEPDLSDRNFRMTIVSETGESGIYVITENPFTTRYISDNGNYSSLFKMGVGGT